MNEAEGGGQCQELVKLRLVDRFGVKAVTGREVLAYGDIIRMMTAENVYKAKQASADSENWAEWARMNPTAAKLLAKAERLSNG